MYMMITHEEKTAENAEIAKKNNLSAIFALFAAFSDSSSGLAA
jgi:hypothetical protein